jgi:hypothetical protein
VQEHHLNLLRQDQVCLVAEHTDNLS